jgi:DNA gyrase/topoisomerase IV subunit B
VANNKIIDDIYTTIENDIEKIQKKSTLYISYVGPKGTEHLAKEMTNNMIDEHNNPKSVSNGDMTIFYDASDMMLYFEDTGRGIPFVELENVCTILQSGSKMDRDNGTSAGENGVGMTATNALSEIFEITSTRDGKARFLKFREGKKIDDKIIDIKDKNKHGLLVGFKPSKYFLGREALLPIEDFTAWLTKLSFFIPKDITITFICDNLPGKEARLTKVFKNTKGISGYLQELEPDSCLLSSSIVLSNNTHIREDNIPVRHEDGTLTLTSVDRIISLEFALNFNPKSQDPVFHAYCNNIENIQGGEHQNAVKSAVTAFFTKQAKESQKKGDKLEYNANDVLAGLSIVLNVETDVSTGLFESQTKHRLGSKLFYEPVRKICMEALNNHFKLPESKRDLSKIVDYVKFNAKLRYDTTNKRKQVKTSAPSFMDSKCIAGYTPANNIGKAHAGQLLEIYIFEGDSAGGLGRQARFNNDIQGILCTMGKPSNAYKKTVAAMISSNDMFIPLFDNVLGCGYGKHFNIDNLLYDKIILAPDYDIDGHHITGLFLAAIYRHAPELIRQGKVYRCVTPLYKLKDNTDEFTVDRTSFLYNKSEIFDRFEQLVSKHVKIKFDFEDKDFVSVSNMKRFLSTNRDYYQLLHTLSGHYTLHPDIIEFMATHLDTYKTTIGELSSEMWYDDENDCLLGVYQEEFYHIIPDKIFLNKVKKLTDTIIHGNDGIVYYHMYEQMKSGKIDYTGYKSIGQIMEVCQKFSPDLDDRYKGNGEMDGLDLRELCMNPANRVLMRFTIGDAEQTTEILDNLFLEKNRNIRKQWVHDAEISEDDIDN